MVSGKVTGLLSETRVHAMLGAGLPVALQTGVTWSVWFTVKLPEIYVISGGSVTKQENDKWDKDTKQEIKGS